MYDGYFQAVCAFLALQILAVAGRVYVRAGIVKAFGWDDVAAIVSLMLACLFDCCYIGLITLAGGTVLLTEIQPRHQITAINLGLATEVSYIIASTALKVALGMLLLRVLVKRWMKWTIWIVMGVTVSYGIAYFFVIVFQCGPPRNFARRIIFRQCLPLETINGTSYVHAVLTALADIIYGSLPIIFLWNAEFSKRAKYSIGGILVVGSVGCVCTLIRIGWIHYLVLPTNTYLLTSQGIAVMSSIELSISLVCLSLATYKPLMHQMFGKGSNYYYYSSGSRTGATMSSNHGTVEEIQPQLYMQERDMGRSTGSPSPSQLGSLNTTAKSLNTASPYADSASVESDHWRGGIAT